jgi:hypothetical protein
MDSPSPQPPAIRRVTLSDGSTLEVLHFDEVAVADELQRCPHCHCDLVQPLDWERSEPARWKVLLECPNCDWNGQSIVSTDALEAYDEALQEGCERLSADLSVLAHANMEEDVERFAEALHAGHIWPIDF